MLEATQLAELLERNELRIVFAESCTAGLASARLAAVPGISNWHCGSAVTYREATKIGWLGVSDQTLASHSAESAETTIEMATQVLSKTPEADVAAAITGHLGPKAPPELDGVAFVAVVRRGEDPQMGQVRRHRLESAERQSRMDEAARLVLAEAVRVISGQR
jgi:nicotinamide-nucleotide amidase